MKKHLLTLTILVLKMTICLCQTNGYYPTSIEAGQNNGCGIRYVDIMPDDTLKTTPFANGIVNDSLDLDGNDTIDFIITHNISSPSMLGYKSSELFITPSGANSICVSNTNMNLADSLRYDDIIDSTIIWSNLRANLFSFNWSMNGTTNTSGYWYYNNKYFVGVRINTGAKVLFGWLDVRCSDYYSFSSNIITQHGVTDFCQTSVNELVKTSNKLFISPNPFYLSTTIKTNNNLKNATLNIFNVFGQEVKIIKNISGQTMTFSRGNLSSGIYFIRLTQDNKVITTDKLVITD